MSSRAAEGGWVRVCVVCVFGEGGGQSSASSGTGDWERGAWRTGCPRARAAVVAAAAGSGPGSARLTRSEMSASPQHASARPSSACTSAASCASNAALWVAPGSGVERGGRAGRGGLGRMRRRRRMRRARWAAAQEADGTCHPPPLPPPDAHCSALACSSAQACPASGAASASRQLTIKTRWWLGSRWLPSSTLRAGWGMGVVGAVHGRSGS